MNVPPDDIHRAVAHFFHISVAELRGPRKFKALIIARQAGFWVMQVMHPEYSLIELGRQFGGRDHSTISHGITTHKKRMAQSRQFARQCAGLVSDLWGGDLVNTLPESTPLGSEKEVRLNETIAALEGQLRKKEQTNQKLTLHLKALGKKLDRRDQKIANLKWALEHPPRRNISATERDRIRDEIVARKVKARDQIARDDIDTNLINYWAAGQNLGLAIQNERGWPA